MDEIFTSRTETTAALGRALAAVADPPELVLKSRWVLPWVLLESGFAFAHPDLPAVLHDIVAGGLSAAARRTPPAAASPTAR